MFNNFKTNLFKCDRQSKYDFTFSIANYLFNQLGKKGSVTFKEYDKNGNLVPFDTEYVDDKCRTDLVMFYTTSTNTQDVRYEIELKERWKHYTSDYYGKEGDKEGWMLNIDKVEELNKKEGIPLYVNLYPDNKIRIWNLNKTTDYQTITKPIHKTTVLPSEVKLQDRYEVWNKDSILIDRVKGYKTNGYFTSCS